ncbi:carboxymuconolactone decarboxylase family protein [Saccharospirillum salsuginis]|uniref:Alkyl hydroperoxide reductase AhpD n=1 Tax=Saccharospirillum salsuginis TaxID=418750 RepID=A0A918KNR7_9GAMM|nr:carboxymuconolactone decarboxylase family protein [Saccharospirillum salsuginis]GGX70776.1 alkyl hydroperoxide reductase AhpD [Saccharospirillum salsuginis]
MFQEHTRDSAPKESAEVMKGVEQSMGFVPNLFAYLAESPTAMKAYTQLNALLGESSLTPQQVQISVLAVSVANQCRFCVAAHSAGATKAGVDPNTITALREGRAPDNREDAALADFAQSVVRERGWVGEQKVRDFLDAGFTQANVMDVLTAVAMKTLSNYSNHMTDPSLNPELEPFAWEPADT